MNSTHKQKQSHNVCVCVCAHGWIFKTAHCGDVEDTLHCQGKDTACPSERGGGEMNHILLSYWANVSPSSLVCVTKMVAMLKDADGSEKSQGKLGLGLFLEV